MYGDCDFLDLKGIIENLLDRLGITKAKYVRETENSAFHPGKTASLMLRGNKVAVFGEIHPDVQDEYAVETPMYVAEVNLNALYEAANIERKYTPIAKFPAATRDIAILVDDEVLAGDIEEIIRKTGSSLVESVTLFDIYKGKQTGEGNKSMAYAIVYRDSKKSLKDEDVNKVHDKILKALESKLGAQLR